ncbi:MAG: AbrB/MazE/SpoVT family DNA-binding domain-containing protein [Chloroflexi bacterium]|nr:AbrB/MazE/SpoVT family DNA-binding domain-containing protein [Chloroflexota bacterium]
MRARVQKWGNSLALRIPKPYAEEIQLEQDAPVDLYIIDGKLVITPVIEPAAELAELLEQVTEQNLHREVDTGWPVGNEVW